MDLEVEADLRRVEEVLKTVGFSEVKLSDRGLEAKMKDGYGRVHVLGFRLDGDSVCLDIHRDSPIHLGFIGVDYSGEKVREVSGKILEYASKIGVSGEVYRRGELVH